MCRDIASLPHKPEPSFARGSERRPVLFARIGRRRSRYWDNLNAGISAQARDRLSKGEFSERNRELSLHGSDSQFGIARRLIQEWKHTDFRARMALLVVQIEVDAGNRPPVSPLRVI